MQHYNFCLYDNLVKSTFNHSLYLTREHLKNDNLLTLKQYLCFAKGITDIHLESKSETKHIIPLFQLISQIYSIKTLNLIGNDLSVEHLAQLNQLLNINKSIENLILDNCNIDIHSVIAFANILKFNTSLKTVSLNENSLGDEGVILIAEAINSNPGITLSQLNLGTNGIRTPGLKALVSMIQSNSTIKQLNIQYNSVFNGDNNPILERLDNELNKNKQANAEKIEKITQAHYKILLVDSILFDLNFQKETGHRQGLIDLKENVKCSLPVLEKWEKMQQTSLSRKNTFSAYLPTMFSGRNDLTQDLYNYIETDSINKLEEMRAKYNYHTSFYHV